MKSKRQPPTILDARVLSGAGGGPDKTLIHSAPYLAKAGYRMFCAYLHAPSDPGFATLRERARALGTDLISIADRGPFDWRVLPRLLDVCRRERVRVWHGHDYKTNALGLVLRRQHPMRLVTTAHGWVQHTRRTPLYYFVDRLSLRYYERVLCVSADLLAACRRAGVPGSRCLLLENGIDVDVYQRRRTPAEARTSLGWPQRLTIGAVGRLSAEKGFALLIRAVDRLLARGVDVQLAIAGDGMEHAALARLIAELGRGERISLLGFRTDLVPLYEAFDVYALSSLREGLPNVLLEAMAMKVPVVASRIAGVPGLVVANETGELIDPGRIDELTAALERLLHDSHLRDRYAVAGRKLVESNFSFATRMARLANIYDDMGLRRDT